MLIAEYTYVTTSEVRRIERRKRLNPAGRKARSGTSVVSGARVPARYLHEEFRAFLFFKKKKKNVTP